MKRKISRIVSLALALMIIGVNTAFAATVISGDQNSSRSEDSTIQPRSNYLGSAISEITNEGEGVLGIYADFRSYAGVEWGQITIKLQRRKNPSTESWSPVKTYTFEFNGDDYPDGKITYAYADFQEDSYASGYYYRLTCTHKVKTPSGSYESKLTQTDGVLLTSYPVFRSADEKE